MALSVLFTKTELALVKNNKHLTLKEKNTIDKKSNDSEENELLFV